ncbi:hypothetical protein BJ508DRAFT_373209 [Ascobolus immersus RN42]|uniref:F-box domain-containing protein n=1 Tax=Ascobolus immersus RN42 TaxID=1160509 RepID=A0A3N4IWP3_ASCIM|nr:hypothetical protein BJ508DRAFT_373209 [Ascobolus immersus RN42]
MAQNNDAIGPSTSPKQTSRFFALTPEIRLEIYYHCTVLDLLILTHTCRAIYFDINTRENLLLSSAGYDNYTHRVKRISKKHLAAATYAGIMDSLCIPMIAYKDKLDFGGKLLCDREKRDSGVHVYNKVYGVRLDAALSKKGWRCCFQCHQVKRIEDYPNMMNKRHQIRSIYCDRCFNRFWLLDPDYKEDVDLW